MKEEKKRISPHLVRAPQELLNTELQKFYNSLLNVLKNPIFRNGNWSLLECHPAWNENNTWDNFLAFTWEGVDNNRMLVCVNYSSDHGQCYVRLPFSDLKNKQWRLIDLMGEVNYDREGNDLIKAGLYLDVPGWKYHVFEMKELKK